MHRAKGLFGGHWVGVGLILFLLLAGSLAQAAVIPAVGRVQPKRMALLIGNANYQNKGIRNLNNPVNDAKLLGNVFRTDLRFDEVVELHDLNVQQMDKAIDDFIKLADQKQVDNVVFYFSGHGKVSENRENFLLPVGVDVNFADSTSLERQAVSADKVRLKLQKLGARITLLILDACRDGGPGLGKSGDKGLVVGGGGPGVLVAYATAEGRIAADGEGANSPYAEALATALRNVDLPVLAQLDYVKAVVRNKRPAQVPTRNGDLDIDAALAACRT